MRDLQHRKCVLLRIFMALSIPLSLYSLFQNVVGLCNALQLKARVVVTS